jgi:hypothetical protein
MGAATSFLWVYSTVQSKPNSYIIIPLDLQCHTIDNNLITNFFPILSVRVIILTRAASGGFMLSEIILFEGL